MRVAVTGGSGFIGTNAVEAFVAQGWTVLNLDVDPPRNAEHEACWRRADILDRPTLLDAVAEFQPDALVHLAARTDLAEGVGLEGYAANVEGVENVCAAVASVDRTRRALFASTQLVCELGYRPSSVDDVCPTTTYGHSKAEGERIVREHADMGAAWAILRPTSIWGPWFGTPYLEFFETIDKGRYVHARGVETRKQWGFVGNVTHALVRLLQAEERAVDGQTMYLADYDAVKLQQFANQVQRALGARRIPSVSYPFLRGVALLGDGLKNVGWESVPLTSFRLRNITTDEVQDTRALREAVGPLPYTVEDGIAKTVAWLRSQPARPRGAREDAQPFMTAGRAP